MNVLPASALPSRGADYNRTYRHLVIDQPITVEEILKPAFWAHHWRTLNVNDMIDILTIDGTIDMQVRVVGKGTGYVEMRVLRLWQREAPVTKAAPVAEELECPENYEVKFAPKTLWRVFTKVPVQEISTGHKTKTEAIAASITHAAKAAGLVAA